MYVSHVQYFYRFAWKIEEEICIFKYVLHMHQMKYKYLCQFFQTRSVTSNQDV